MMAPSKARAVLDLCNAHGQFHALPSSAVDALLAEADAVKYRRLKNVNGSRARCFHAYLTRRSNAHA